jgi:7-cyano-7-deazaguanine synthase
MSKDKVIVSLSGGMDSATLAGYFLTRGYEVIPVNFTYGSKHNKYEKECAKKLCEYYNLPDIVEIHLGFIEEHFKSNLLKSGGDIPEGHYAGENMRQTVVPGRNLIFGSILAGYAESIGANSIALGVHSGDHHIYPDCRPEFMYYLKRVVEESTDGKIEVMYPFLRMDKTKILEIGYKHNKPPTPYELTRTCYKDQELSCGVCGSCNERLEAFENILIADPIKYEDNKYN